MQPFARAYDSHSVRTRGPKGLSRANRDLAACCPAAELDRLNPKIVRQRRLVLPNLADHRLGCLPLEEELDDLLSRALTTP
jgi:hypothetical protein